MRSRELLSEAWRNITSGTTRSFLLGMLLAALVLVLIGTDAMALRDLLREERAALTDSGATWEVSAPGRIDGAACTALGRIPGVRGSVALSRDPDGLPVPALRGAEPTLFGAAGDLAATFGASTAPAIATGETSSENPPVVEPPVTDGPPPASGGLVLSSALAQRLNVDTSRPLPLQQADGTISQVPIQQIVDIRDGDRGTSISVSAFMPVPASGTFDACYVTVWPADARLEDLLTAVAEGGDESPVDISLLHPSARPPETLQRRAETRPTRFAASLAVPAGLLLGAASVRSRRTELALARQLGQSRRAVSAQILVEAGLWIGTSCAVSSLVIAQFVLRDVDATATAFLIRDLAISIGSVAASTLLGAVVAAWHISPQHLMRWARER